jgi:hypothetical protein
MKVVVNNLKRGGWGGGWGNNYIPYSIVIFYATANNISQMSTAQSGIANANKTAHPPPEKVVASFHGKSK